MASVSGPTKYPWGTAAPRQRLPAVSAKAAKVLEDARSPGFSHVSSHVKTSVKAARDLVETMQHLAQIGLRSGDSKGQKRLSFDEVQDAAQKVNHAVDELAASSPLTISERYEAFSEAVTALVELADESLRRGIVRSTGEPVEKGWAAFEC